MGTECGQKQDDFVLKLMRQFVTAVICLIMLILSGCKKHDLSVYPKINHDTCIAESSDQAGYDFCHAVEQLSVDKISKEWPALLEVYKEKIYAFSKSNKFSDYNEEEQYVAIFYNLSLKALEKNKIVTSPIK